MSEGGRVGLICCGLVVMAWSVAVRIVPRQSPSPDGPPSRAWDWAGRLLLALAVANLAFMSWELVTGRRTPTWDRRQPPGPPGIPIVAPPTPRLGPTVPPRPPWTAAR